MSRSAARFRIELPVGVVGSPVTGRVYVLLSRRAGAEEPRLQRVGWGSVEPFFGLDVEALAEGQAVVIDERVPGYPYGGLLDVPAGRYRAQALMDVYELYRRCDGVELWAPRVGWEGRVFTKTPGNLYSEPVDVEVGPGSGVVELRLDRVVEPVVFPGDSAYVKRVRLESKLLTAFWGRPMELGATVLLPAGYDEEPERRYPVVYVQDHFNLEAPFGFPEHVDTDATRRAEMANEIQLEASEYHRQLGHVETPAEFASAWLGPDFPRMIAVTFQHPNPWFDSSHAVNSANAGPFGDAIMRELLPEVERRFRVIQEPWARVLTGGSTGGWTALNLQISHPDTFGGAWVLFPDSVDFRRLVLTDIYGDENVYVALDREERDRDHRLPSQEWLPGERPFRRSVEGQIHVTMRDMSRLEAVIASRCRSGIQLQPWQAIFGPVGDDGYPRPLWDEQSGRIDREVAHYWRDSGYDLSHTIRTNWAALGPRLAGKLHFFAGEMDNYFLNAAMYLLEDFLEQTTDPHYAGSFEYGRPKQGHYYIPWTHTQLIHALAEHIHQNTPRAPGSTSTTSVSR